MRIAATFWVTTFWVTISRATISRATISSATTAVRVLSLGAALLLGLGGLPQNALAQTPSPGAKTVQIDFKNADLSDVIKMIAGATGKSFIYDEKVRGKVTVISPTPVSITQAYAVFESILKTKGFTVIEGPAGMNQIIAIREAKESNIQTIKDNRPSAYRDHYVTRLIPLKYIDADAITNTIKPLVSKEASMVAYEPTNTIILTDTATNIRRLLTILEAIDVETFKEELAVIKIQHADAGTLGDQISEIYQAETSGGVSSSSSAAKRARSSRRNRASKTTPSVSPASRGKIRLITDDRTNSLLVLASRAQLKEIRSLIKSLDVPVRGEGRIRVYYLKHADAEELAQTLNGLLGGQRRSPTPGRSGRSGAAAATPQALRGTVTAFAEGIQLNADPATNSLVIQASKEAYETLLQVIELLDIERPQVLVEALIMEVTVSGGQELGMNTRLILDNTVKLAISSATDTATRLATTDNLSTSGAAAIVGPVAGISAFGANFLYSGGGTTIQAILRATASDAATNIVAAPHILTSDNEEAEIQIGQNIPIITNRVSSATGQTIGQSTSVAIERQDVGVILRVTPQISEGDSVRLKIFQENTTIIEDAATGDPNEVGVSLAKRKVENTLVVRDGQTVVIGGLLSEDYTNTEVKTPFLGDIPLLGWLFKTKTKRLRKTNLLVFLTPHIIRSPAAMERETIRKRRQFEERLGGEFLVSGERSEREERNQDSLNPVIVALNVHADRYPLARMQEIEANAERTRIAEMVELERLANPDLWIVHAGVFHNERLAAERLTLLVDRGYEAQLSSGESEGRLAFELQVGPYDTAKEANAVARVLSEAFGFKPSVSMLPPTGGSTENPE